MWVKFIASGKPTNLTGVDRSRCDAWHRNRRDRHLARRHASRLHGENRVEHCRLKHGRFPRRLVARQRSSSQITSVYAGRWIDARSRSCAQRRTCRRPPVGRQRRWDESKRRSFRFVRGRHIHWPTWSRDGYIYFIDTTAPLLNMEPSGISRIRPGPTKQSNESSRHHGARSSHCRCRTETALFMRQTQRRRSWVCGGARRSGGADRRLTIGIGEYAEPRISTDGKTLVATRYDVHQSLIRIDVRQEFRGDEIHHRWVYREISIPAEIDPFADRLVFSSSRTRETGIFGPLGSMVPMLGPSHQVHGFMSGRRFRPTVNRLRSCRTETESGRSG